MEDSYETEYEKTKGSGVWKKLIPAIAIILLLVFAAFIGSQFYFQQKKLDEIAAEKQQLQQKIEELTREQERLEGNLEYVKSLEGLLQYARENLGYSLPDDIRIDVSD